MIFGLLRVIRLTFIAICVFAPCVGECSNDDTLKWTEDVQLADGRVVELTRYQEFKGPYVTGDTPTESDYWFEFKHPQTGQIVRWQSDRDLGTLALMMQGQVPVLLTKPAFGSSAFRYGCPNPPYLLFRYGNDEWKQVEITEIPVKQVRVNMTYAPKDRRELIRASKFHLTADQIRSAPYQGRRQPVINFEKPFRQTFDGQNCDRIREYLID